MRRRIPMPERDLYDVLRPRSLGGDCGGAIAAPRLEFLACYLGIMEPDFPLCVIQDALRPGDGDASLRLAYNLRSRRPGPRLRPRPGLARRNGSARAG